MNDDDSFLFNGKKPSLSDLHRLLLVYATNGRNHTSMISIAEYLVSKYMNQYNDHFNNSVSSTLEGTTTQKNFYAHKSIIYLHNQAAMNHVDLMLDVLWACATLNITPTGIDDMYKCLCRDLEDRKQHIMLGSHILRFTKLHWCGMVLNLNEEERKTDEYLKVLKTHFLSRPR